ncbi:TonB-dependent siderophore receptor [Magnetospirillum aberrantis]|uniref:TonB-dependent receptor n=1 Tax=Magnetospirillum aberrantis SpK TaxID=908842 RepID=A0A7C9QSN4_9PROT|nr:TonB-dependent receptor [Magnetospirillum aberrantis]NFV79259.1 TonB-dependent receptor [Magnetospirillum aberrantis SpK]
MRPQSVSRSFALTAGTAMSLVLSAFSPAAAQTASSETEATAEVVVTDQQETPEGSVENGYRYDAGNLGPLGKTSLQDTPYSLHVTSGEMMRNREAHTLEEALKPNPTVASLLNSNGINSLTRMMIRGFTAADGGELRDGLVDRSFTFPPMEIVDRIEVLNGFNGFLYGFSAPGGTINYVSKMPTEKTLTSATAGVYGGGIGYVHADLGGKVASTGNRLGYRFNAYRENGSTFIDGGEQDRALVSGVLTYQLAPDTVVRADMWHQDYKVQGLSTYFRPNGGNWSGTGIRVPDAKDLDPSTQYTQPWTYNQSEKTVVGTGLDSKLNDTFTLRTGYRYATMWRRDTYVNAVLLDNSGNYSEVANIEPTQSEQYHSAYALMDAKFGTFGIGHEVTFGYTGTDMYYKRANKNTQTLGNASFSSQPSYSLSATAYTFAPNNNFQQTYNNNYLLGDTLTLNEQWKLLLGITHARYDQHAWGRGTTISTSNYKAEANTPSVGVVFKPVPEASLYASYVEALQQGDSTSDATAVNANQVLPPSISKQYETGVKARIGEMDLTGALFHIDKVNAGIDPSDHMYKQDGREIHQGLEVTAIGKLTDRLTLGGGFTVMDAHIEKAQAAPATKGKTPINVPEEMARLWVEYALPFVPDLSVTGGMNYYGERPVDSLNTQYMDGATIFDAGLRYTPELYGHPVTVNLNVSNVFDTAYWAYYRSSDGLVLGAPRVFSLSVRTEW